MSRYMNSLSFTEPTRRLYNASGARDRGGGGREPPAQGRRRRTGAAASRHNGQSACCYVVGGVGPRHLLYGTCRCPAASALRRSPRRS